MSHQPKPIYEFGHYRLDAAERLLSRDGEVVPLQPKTFDVLLTLVERHGRLLEKDELMRAVWPDTVVEEVNLANNISILRKVLGDGGNGQQFIETAPKRGYRFVAEVREIGSIGLDPTAHSAITVEEKQENIEEASARQKRARRRKAAIAAGVALLCVAALGYFGLGRKAESVAPGSIKSIAVLPLKSLNREAGDDYLELGIADAIITRTSQMRTLIVRPISAVSGYRNQVVDPLEVARQLQVDAVLEGSAQRAGGRLRVSLNLLRARDGASLWSDSFDREMKNAFALQDDISLNVVRSLKLTLTASEEKRLASPFTRNAEAYDYYLRGRFYQGRFGRENAEMAMTMFERATSLDPSFALAQAGLANASTNFFFNFDADKKFEEKAYVALENALALDPNLAEAYVARGNLIWTFANGFPHERAEKEFRRALAINPNLASAHLHLGSLYSHIGLLDQALAELQAAMRLNPTSQGVAPRIARIYWYQQKYELALAEYEKGAVGGMVAEKGLTLWHLGRKDEAFALVEKRLKQASEDRNILSELRAIYAIMLADAGRRRKAEEHIRLAVERGQDLSHFHHAAFSIACAYALMGRKQSAMEWLEKTAEQGMPCYTLFDSEPALNGLRSDLQFKALIAKLKKQWEVFLREFS